MNSFLSRPASIGNQIPDSNGQPDPQKICPSCPLFRTKPGDEPVHIAQSLNFAMEHEEMVKNGWRFNNPNVVSPLGWAAITGLTRGRARFDEYLREQRDLQSENNNAIQNAINPPQFGNTTNRR